MLHILNGLVASQIHDDKLGWNRDSKSNCGLTVTLILLWSMCPIPTAMSLHCQCYRPITVAKGKVKYLVAIKKGNVYMPSLIHEFKLECDCECDWFYLYHVTKFCVLICNCYKIKIITVIIYTP